MTRFISRWNSPKWRKAAVSSRHQSPWWSAAEITTPPATTADVGYVLTAITTTSNMTRLSREDGVARTDAFAAISVRMN